MTMQNQSAFSVLAHLDDVLSLKFVDRYENRLFVIFPLFKHAVGATITDVGCQG